jgi:6,7-dimethyl-8-ribityllumazine synthase
MSERWPGEPDVFEEGVDTPVLDPIEQASVAPAPTEPAPAPSAAVPPPSPQHAVGDLDIPGDVDVLEGVAGPVRRSVAIVVSKFNGEITSKLLASALEELDRIGIERRRLMIVPVPGAFELPLAAMALAKTRRYTCIVALGCVIRGETPHFEFVASEAASGLQLAALETGVPVAFGVLTTETAEQAEARVGKGAEAVRTGLEMADLFTQLRQTAVRQA